MTIETKQARQIVSSLAVMNPHAPTDGSEIECFFCGNKSRISTPIEHAETCLWKMAHDLCFPEEHGEDPVVFDRTDYPDYPVKEGLPFVARVGDGRSFVTSIVVDVEEP